MKEEKRKMKNLIKKQEEEFEELFVGVQDDGTYKQRDDLSLKSFIAKIRKETAEYVFNKLEERNSFFKNFETSKLEEEKQEGYNERKLEEKEIKKEILNNL